MASPSSSHVLYLTTSFAGIQASADVRWLRLLTGAAPPTHFRAALFVQNPNSRSTGLRFSSFSISEPLYTLKNYEDPKELFFMWVFYQYSGIIFYFYKSLWCAA